MKKILPSILSADFANLERDVRELEQIGIDIFHIDVMDGNFVPNISFGFPIIEAIRSKTDKIFDCHLMIARPEEYVERFCNAGCDMVSFHIEATNHADRVIQIIKNSGKKAGIVLNPQTPIESVKYLLPKLDYVLIMTVNPGFGGQKFIPEMVQKIKDLREIDKNIDIEVDGGINNETAKLVKEAGANILVAGSYIFSGNYKEKIESLK